MPGRGRKSNAKDRFTVEDRVVLLDDPLRYGVGIVRALSPTQVQVEWDSDRGDHTVRRWHDRTLVEHADAFVDSTSYEALTPDDYRELRTTHKTR
jgi:hypothetical protein